MKWVLPLFGFAIILLVSCKKSNSDFGTGIYTESTPVPGRSQLNFISSKVVVKSETGSNYKDTFTYVISPGKISLTPAWTNQYAGQQFDFEQVDGSSFKIENLYPGIPELPKSYMIFKK